MPHNSFVACCDPDPRLNAQQNLAVQAFKALLLHAPTQMSRNRRDWVPFPGGAAKLEVLTNTGIEGSYIFDVKVTEEKGAGKKPN